ncbi:MULTISPECIES: hypothetical protein [unclassified Microcoleus]|uniref:hypothetical protein n=1 Tax=unclassified Microcoleus TaxID=2642155 RepID=UPI002FD5A9CD
MTASKKGVDAIKKALAAADDKAEFDTEIEVELLPILPTLKYLPENSEKSAWEKEETLSDFAKQIDDCDDGINLFNPTESLGTNVATALANVTSGLKPWEYNFLSAYATLPSVLCKILPIVEIVGSAGSGKSQLLLAISSVSGQSVISGQSTGASLKNHINAIRWHDPETKSHEKNTLLLIDNLNEDSFKKEEYLSSFLNGYNRKTDKCFISNGKGQNIEFRTFCGKLYTTIWEKTSTELSRRTVTIRTTKTAKLDELLDPDDISWKEMRSAVKTFWEQKSNWLTFKEVERRYGTTAKPRHSKEYWTLLKYPLISGVVIGSWDTLTTAIDETSAWLDNALKSRNTLLEVIILKSIEEVLGFKQLEWPELSKRVKIHVAPKPIKIALEIAIADGLIDRPKLTEVQQCLGKLGFGAGLKDGTMGYSYKATK